MDAGFNFDKIQTGDILTFGNHGFKSEDVAKMFISIEAEKEKMRQESEEQVLRERERRFIIASSVTIGSLLFLLLIYLITKKYRSNG